jgi:hypothetical protein
MSKVIIILTAAVLALTLSEVAAAADKDQNIPQLQPLQLGDPAAGGATASQREWEYLAALQKCEPLAGADKTNCVNVAREKYGQM